MKRYVIAGAFAGVLLATASAALVFTGVTEKLTNRVLVFVFGSPLTPFPVALPEIGPEQAEACSANVDPLSHPIAPYWPPAVFGGPAGDFRSAWYSAQLCALGQGPLARPDADETLLRFSWLRSFHPAVVVTVHHSSTDTKLTAVREAGENSGTKLESRRSLTNDQWKRIETLLSEVGFWFLPTDEPILGLDGARWIFEVSESHRYHIVDRWSGNDLERVGRTLLELADLEVGPVY